MTHNHSHNKKRVKNGQKFHQTVWEDFRRGGIKRTLKQDLKDIYHFYIDNETQSRLMKMGRVRRWMRVVFYILKNMILKLTPVRRILLLFGISLILRTFVASDEIVYAGILVILFILMLELKDKLLAHDELAAGRVVQFALMPDDNPKIPGWDIWLFTRPANEIGGDLVDYLWISDDRLGLTLGDVAGKGLGAALYMAKLQATLRALAPNFKSLTKLGTELNKIFRRDGLPSRFISLVYLELGRDSGRVRIVNAGHLPPFLLKAGKIQEIEHGAPALGILPEPTYTEQHIDLKSGELLFIYSDGLTEARNDQGEFFGDQRLLDLLTQFQSLSAEKIGKLIMSEIDKYIGNARSSDDLSLIILKCLS